MRDRHPLAIVILAIFAALLVPAIWVRADLISVPLTVLIALMAVLFGLAGLHDWLQRRNDRK